jgi:GxxExxY protein
MMKDDLTEKIIGACYEVHRTLGPGFNEKLYQNSLKLALKERELKCVSERNYEVYFKENPVGNFRVDLLVEDRVVVEVKAAVGSMPKVFESQLISYLKASKHPTGLLVNFGNASCHVKRFSISESLKTGC